MELENLFGLPAHPLVVHAAVVLLPLAAIGALVTALVPKSRRPYALITFVLAVAATGFVGLAQGSGEALEENVDETELVEEHTEQGELVLPWAIGLTVVSAGVLVLSRVRSVFGREPGDVIIRTVIGSLALVTSIGATASVVVVGHSGAKATWSEDGEKSDGEHEGNEDESDRDDD